jgi:hypothetical protein
MLFLLRKHFAHLFTKNYNSKKEIIKAMKNNYEPTNYDLQNQLATNTNAMLNEIYSFRRHMDQKLAPPRAKKTNFTVTQCQTGDLFFTEFYDIAPPKSFFIFNYSLGAFVTYKINFEDFDCEKRLFGIYFKKANLWIVGDIDKLSEKYLYELFLEKNISFNQGLPRSKVQRALYEFFKNLIHSCENICTIPGLAGWNKQQFRHCGNILNSNTLNMLPVVRKTFEILPFEDQTFNLYKEFLLQFKDTNTRLMISMYPVVSILSSIFKSFCGNINFSLNLVPTSPLSALDVVEYFQIFSRDASEVFHSSYSKKNLEKILTETKDEILLMDMRLPSSADYYRLKQRNETFEFVSSVLSGRMSLSSQRGNATSAGLVTICDETILKPNVFNILTASEFKSLSVYDNNSTNYFKKEKVMTRLFSQFVRYIEDMNADFLAIFTRSTNSQTHVGRILEITYELFCDFWKNHNIDFAKELNFPENIQFDNIFPPESEDDDEDVTIFIEKIKEALSEYHIVPKKGADVLSKCVFYDNFYVYFPVQIMENICADSGIKTFKKILVKLRSKNLLSASQDRLSKQVVIGHINYSCYVLRRELFDKTGELNIAFIGKENEQC